MSRVGKYPVEVPQNVSIKSDDCTVIAEGPKGTLSTEVGVSFKVDIQENEVWILPKEEITLTQDMKAYWGLYRSLVSNIIKGVAEGYSKYLNVEGVGYRARLEEDTLILNLGYSHEVTVKAPEGITFSVENNQITVSGIDKQLVGQVAADVRAKRPPEPYKGKGIRYSDEQIRIKEGKTAS